MLLWRDTDTIRYSLRALLISLGVNIVVERHSILSSSWCLLNHKSCTDQTPYALYYRPLTFQLYGSYLWFHVNFVAWILKIRFPLADPRGCQGHAPLSPIPFIYMRFSVKIWLFTPTFGVGGLSDILDPPLFYFDIIGPALLKAVADPGFPRGRWQSCKSRRGQVITGQERLIRSHSSARFCFELSGNSN